MSRFILNDYTGGLSSNNIKLPPTPESLMVHALSLYTAEMIKLSEYKNLIKMLHSPDKENHVLAQELINKI